MRVFPPSPSKYPALRVRPIQPLTFHQGILASLSASLLDRVLAVLSLAQSLESSSRAALRATDTTRSGAARALIRSRVLPTSPIIRDSSRLSRIVLAHQDLIWVPASTLLNHSCPTPPTRPVRPTQCRPHPRPLIRMLNPRAVAVVRNLTYMLCITMVEVHLLRSSLVALVLQNSLHHTSADPMNSLLGLSLLLAVPTATTTPTPTPTTPVTGDHDLVPLLVNLRSETNDRLIFSRTWLRGLVQGVYLIVNFVSIFCASCHHHFLGCMRTVSDFCFPSFTDATMILSPPSFQIHRPLVHLPCTTF